LEIKSGNWLYGVKYSMSQPLRVNAKARSIVARINLVQLKLKKSILYLILSLGIPLYREGYHMYCQQSLNAKHSLKTQVR
jgi:hypothetical protein